MHNTPVAPSVAQPSPVAGRNILVTGGAGSFGQAFVRRCLADGARRVVVFSRDEAKHAAMRVELDDPRLRFLIGDVRDATRLLDACRGIDVVVHAAALKRIENCEADPNEAVATNVLGTQHVARACIERGVARAVFLSTDKAAAPNTLYGATKLAAERLWLASNVYATGTATRFAATRYGNVLGSRGSVVPIWRAQAALGRPLTITDPLMSRFFMRMDEAVELVLLALADCRPGALYVPKIGAASVEVLARVVGGPTAQLHYTGIRPGEKLHETLITEDEARRTHDVGGLYVVDSEAPTWGDLPPLAGRPLNPGFTYRSDTARQIPPAGLARMVAT